jgi:putative two-component system response regulator
LGGEGGHYAGLSGEDIPVAARIVAVADVYDALCHERPYKPAWPELQAVQEILDLRGRQFDPRVVDAFMAVRSAGGLRGLPADVTALAG